MAERPHRCSVGGCLMGRARECPDRGKQGLMVVGGPARTVSVVLCACVPPLAARGGL